MNPRQLFRDRAEAGRQLAARLRSYRDQSPIVLGLPRGGVSVAYEVARALDAPLEVCPSNEDQTLDVRGQTVIVLDDGLATSENARGALQILRERGAARLVLAVPVAEIRALDELGSVADEVVCLYPIEPLVSVQSWYEELAPTDEDEVIALLADAAAHRRRSRRIGIAADCEVQIPLELASAPGAVLEGHLAIPPGPKGIVVLVSGSGSNRRSTRNRLVAKALDREGFATLLVDLLTTEEALTDARMPHRRFDTDLLSARLLKATVWARSQTQLMSLPLGYVAAGTGAAAALVAAAARPDAVQAVVSRGGRLDLAEPSLADVRAPTLLLVGGDDAEILQLSRESINFLAGETELIVVHGATHLFEEPGAFDEVIHATARWFDRHLPVRDEHLASAS